MYRLLQILLNRERRAPARLEKAARRRVRLMPAKQLLSAVRRLSLPKALQRSSNVDVNEQRLVDLKTIIQNALSESEELGLFLERLKREDVETRMVLSVEALFIHHASECPVVNSANGPLSSLSEDQ